MKFNIVKRQHILFGSVAVFYFILQLFFIHADADSTIEFASRGAYMDEALYSFQTREFCDGLGFDLEINDAFVRTPLYQVVVFLFFKIFGTHLWAIRLISILSSLASTFLLYKVVPKKTVFTFLVFVPILQLHIFTISHLGLVYPLGVFFIVLGFYYYTLFDKTNTIKKLALSSVFLICACFVSIQFIGIPLTLPLTLLVRYVLLKIRKQEAKFLQVLMASLFTLISYLVYYFSWYHPNRFFLKKTFKNLVGERFPTSFEQFLTTVKYNIKEVLYIENTKIFVLLFVCLMFVLIIRLFLKKGYQNLNAILFLFLWLLIESPRLSMPYLPYRYLYSFLIALTFIGVILLVINSTNKWQVNILTIITIFIVTFEASQLIKSMQRNEYQIRFINSKYANKFENNSTILGSWAPSFTWDSKVKCIPIWRNYLNDSKSEIINSSSKFIISEKNELDSDGAFKQHQLYLNQIALKQDSFRISSYEIEIFKVNALK